MRQISAVRFMVYMLGCFLGGIIFDRAYLIDWEAQALSTRYCVAEPPAETPNAEDIRVLFGK